MSKRAPLTVLLRSTRSRMSTTSYTSGLCTCSHRAPLALPNLSIVELRNHIEHSWLFRSSQLRAFGHYSSSLKPHHSRERHLTTSIAHRNRKDAESTSETRSNSTRPSRSRSSLGLIGLTSLSGAMYALYRFFGFEDPNKRRLSQDYFVPLRIKQVEHINPDFAILEIEVPESQLPSTTTDDGTSGGPDRIWSVYVKQPDLQIQRPYTPLSPDFTENRSAPSSGRSSGRATSTIRLFVKRYQDGEVSRYLHRLGPGDEIQIRAPVLTTRIPQGLEEIVFIAGGTGITPAYQYLDSLSQQSEASTSSLRKVTILYAAADPVLASSLERIKSRISNRDVQIDVFSPDSQRTRIDRRLLKEVLGKGDASQSGKSRLIVVCGPEGMINQISGPRARDLSQGPVGGILKELGYTDQEVIKL